MRALIGLDPLRVGAEGPRVGAVTSLQSSKLFRHLPESEREKLQQVARQLKFSAGQQIFKEGDPGDGVYRRNSACRLSWFGRRARRVRRLRYRYGSVRGSANLGVLL